MDTAVVVSARLRFLGWAASGQRRHYQGRGRGEDVGLTRAGVGVLGDLVNSGSSCWHKEAPRGQMLSWCPGEGSRLQRQGVVSSERTPEPCVRTRPPGRAPRRVAGRQAGPQTGSERMRGSCPFQWGQAQSWDEKAP